MLVSGPLGHEQKVDLKVIEYGMQSAKKIA